MMNDGGEGEEGNNIYIDYYKAEDFSHDAHAINDPGFRRLSKLVQCRLWSLPVRSGGADVFQS